MKHIIHILLATCFIFISCENEISFNGKNEKQQLVINALLDVTQSENCIYLNLTGSNQSAEVKDATVNIYINGDFKETAHYKEKAEYGKDKHFYSVTSAFKPGDKIRVEAITQDGKHHADAQVTVPIPVSIDHIDTATVLKNNSGSYKPMKYLRFKITFKDRPDENDFYRIVVERKDNWRWKSPETQQETDTTVYNYSIVNKEDVVLTDGNPGYADDNDFSDLFGQAQNIYSVFDDSRFKNSEYTMTVSMLIGDATPYYYMEEGELFTKTMTVKLLSICEAEYYYLKALNTFDSDDYNEILFEPVRFPSNVNGGTGMVGISSESSRSFELMKIKFDPEGNVVN